VCSCVTMAPRLTSLAIVVASVAGQGTLDDYKEGKQGDKDDAAAKAAIEAKHAAVNKVITMLEDLQAQVLAEGEKEAASYNTFSCWCKDATKEKTEEISTGEDDKGTLEANIGGLNTKRDNLDADIDRYEKAIDKAEKEMKDAKKTRKGELAVYEDQAADLSGALAGLDGAIEVLKSSKKPSFIQMQKVLKTVQTASALADALGLKKGNGITAFLQQNPAVEMEDYKFHSDSVIDTLENLKKDFRTEKQNLDSDEVTAVSEFDRYIQGKLDFVKRKNSNMEDAKKMKSKTISDIASNSDELTTTSADLLDNKEYLSQTAKMCVNTAKTWDVRSKVRQDELSALVAATTIVKESVKTKISAASVRFAQMGVSVRVAKAMTQDQDAMESVEAEAEAAEGKAPIGFLQRLVQRHTPKSNLDQGRDAVVDLLRTQGAKLHSTLLSQLASQITADPFIKIKKLIQDLIERLLTEAANESNQKGWCDKATADATQKRDYASDAVSEANGQMAEFEARRNKLTEQIDVLEKEIQDLKDRREEATKIRKEEHEENAATVLEADAGLEAVSQAIDILDKFYKTVAKTKVDLSLTQEDPVAPGAGFDIGEAYTGAGGEAGGILGMLDVIKSDFERTTSVTQKAEKAAESEFQDFMTESGKSKVEKEMAFSQKTDQRDATVQDLAEADENLKAESKLLNLAIGELLDLKPTCIDTGMSYDERVSRREDEIEGLKKALCVLKAYAEYGPEGASDAC